MAVARGEHIFDHIDDPIWPKYQSVGPLGNRFDREVHTRNPTSQPPFYHGRRRFRRRRFRRRRFRRRRFWRRRFSLGHSLLPDRKN